MGEKRLHMPAILLYDQALAIYYSPPNVKRLLEKEITNPKCQSTLYLLTLFLIIILQTGKGFDKRVVSRVTLRSYE